MAESSDRLTDHHTVLLIPTHLKQVVIMSEVAWLLSGTEPSFNCSSLKQAEE